MSNVVEAFPLQWPSGWKRTQHRQGSRFGKWNARPTIERGQNEVRRELQMMGARDIIISSNLRLRQDGLPYSQQRTPDDPGVAVYFTRKGTQQVIACDTYDKPGCNLYAISMTVNAMRGIARWGASELLDRAFTGFKALPEQGTIANWWTTLGVAHDSDFDTVKAAYRAMAMQHHPDKGGDPSRFHEIQRAWDEAQKHLTVPA